MSISTLSENRFLDANASYCALTGYTRDELIGRTAKELDLLPQEDSTLPSAEHLADSGRVRNLELAFRTRTGAHRDLLVSAEIIEVGGLTCILSIGFDATERKRLEREVIEGAELERRRIGQDLHDELGQQLTGAAFLSQVLSQRLTEAERAEANEARELTDLLNEILAEARDLSRLLSPVDIFADGLADALQDLADQTERIFEVSCVLDVEGDVRVTDNAAATHLYRIAQESVNNAVKHADPSTIRISLGRYTNKEEQRGLLLRVEDDGPGIDMGAMEQPAGIGLRTMRYRAALIGATFKISHTGGGTAIEAFVSGNTLPSQQA